MTTATTIDRQTGAAAVSPNSSSPGERDSMASTSTVPHSPRVPQ
ncbi:MAG: hypothetical protein OXF25_10000 [Cyanobacteria bacterium MAG CAR3_bin_5]|nr:hypothetical protein [Cyanobacteria bacterium MAG CAR3_bin_5]MCY4235342.1 hypothetical protein [Cyanobacteria bacterium MAG CAR2_bin_4]MCY4333043.1 hypothetical protein [Cyanobacteria bacterium MAG CAR1_bin_15]